MSLLQVAVDADRQPDLELLLGSRRDRVMPGIYAACLVDPDGNNVEAVHRAPAPPST